MRVITGEARGRKLVTLEGEDVRPTTDRVKEGMFNIIQFDVEGANVLDLFAGSGQLGIEALSRGAKHCTFIDSANRSIEVVKQNLKSVGFEKRASVFCGDSKMYIGLSKDKFDIAIIDPPYNKNIIEAVLPSVAEKMTDYGVIICESALEEVLPQSAGEFSIHREYKYGKIKLTVYRKNK
ncbi:MAG: 16S rRNA (guanine(966)-N(2))-methyltransferase RsmD [Clostridia bacterium]|nr:16S rRNA (guanine(966)-N(2))-methyltransferase RsmD [Clostridia bacterium]